MCPEKLTCFNLDKRKKRKKEKVEKLSDNRISVDVKT